MKKNFGTMPDGTPLSLYSFTNKNNMTMAVTDLGATLVSVQLPDREGVVRDVVLGYDTPEAYLKNTCYFGAVIGRSGNRIDQGRFEINGTMYQMYQNDNENNLHSGQDGFDRRKWQVSDLDETKKQDYFHNRKSRWRPGLPREFPGICYLYADG